MRTLAHTLAHRSHSVSKVNLSFVRLAQCSLSPRRFRAADRAQEPQYMKYLPFAGDFFSDIPCSSGVVYLNNEAKTRHMGPSPSGDE